MQKRLPEKRSKMEKIEEYLYRNAELYPGKRAVVCGSQELTYSQLLKAVESRAKELRGNGEGNGKPYAMRTVQNSGFLTDYFAIHLIDGIAVPLESNIPQERLKEIERLIEKTEAPGECADILFTTGTTGKSKGVMISHRTIIANGENLVQGQGFSEETDFIICGPLNHIGSLSKIYPVLIAGGTLHVTEGLKEPGAFYRALGNAGRHATFLVPSAIRMLLTFSSEELKKHASALDFIETGAAPISQTDMEELCRILPDTRLYNTYASTESGILCTYNFNPTCGGEECIAGCLGRPMKHSGIFITENGTVACSGKTLMLGYAADRAATESIMKEEILYTNDCGKIDKRGRLHLTGRRDDTINVGGLKVSPVEVENAALSHPSVADCICIAEEHPLLGNQLKLLVVPASGEKFDKREIARHLGSRLENYKIPSLYQTVESIKRTYNGKTDRRYYRQKS